MSRFLKYLTEMSHAEALHVFGLHEIPSEEELKKIYRKLALKNHPDHGGSEEAMKEVNDAYETLKKTSGSSYTSSKFNWEKNAEEYRELGKVIRNDLTTQFKKNINKFTSYFETIFNTKFEGNITEEFPKESNTNPSFAGFDAKFSANNSSIVFNLHISAYLMNIKHNQGGLSTAGFSYPLTIISYGLFNNKKQKLYSRDFSSSSNHEILENPELIFPKTKLNKIVSGKTSARKFSKRDMYTALKEKLHVIVGNDYTYLPVGTDYVMPLHRYTLMRTSAWTNYDIHKKSKSGYAQGPSLEYLTHKTFPEDENTLNIFEKIQKETNGIDDTKKLKEIINKIVSNEGV